MNINNTDLNLLRVFCVLYEKSHVSEAGKILGLSQPAVSHALNRLRDTFNDPLFVRSARGLIPTARAHELGPFIVRIIHELEATLEKKTFIPATDAGSFSILGTDYFEQTILPILVSVLRIEAPLTKIKSQSNKGILPKIDLEQGLADVAVAGYFGDLPNGFYQQTIFRDRLIGLSRPKHPYLKNPTLKEFVKWPHLVISPEGKFEGPIDKALSKLKMKREVALSVSSFMPTGWIVEDSDLLVAVPERLATQLSRVLSLSTFELPIDLPEINVVQVWHEVVHHDPRHQWLRNKLFQVCQKRPRKI